jgi:hypothetical protein
VRTSRTFVGHKNHRPSRVAMAGVDHRCNRAGGFWQATHPPPQLVEAYAQGPISPPEWTIDFQPTLTRLLTATCVGLI